MIYVLPGMYWEALLEIISFELRLDENDDFFKFSTFNFL